MSLTEEELKVAIARAKRYPPGHGALFFGDQDNYPAGEELIDEMDMGSFRTTCSGPKVPAESPAEAALRIEQDPSCVIHG